MRRTLIVAVLVIGTIAVSACNTVGPKGLKSGAVAYNQAVAQTKDEQMLLNLVRLRYRDATTFLVVNSISAQYVFSADGGASIGVSRPSGSKCGLGACRRT